MIKEKELYRVFDSNELYRRKQIDFLYDIWCTDKFECRNMSMKDAFSNSKCISGCIVDESIKDSLIFTFFEPVNYPVDKDTFIEISYEDLLEYCDKVNMVYCVENE